MKLGLGNAAQLIGFALSLWTRKGRRWRRAYLAMITQIYEETRPSRSPGTIGTSNRLPVLLATHLGRGLRIRDSAAFLGA